MIQVVVALAIVLGGVAVAIVIRRRDVQTMASGKSWSVPAQLEPSDFGSPDVERLVVVFSSATCDACAETLTRVNALLDHGVALAEISYQEHGDLHERYGIDAVPTLVIADREGVVLRSFVGPPSDDELREALIETE